MKAKNTQSVESQALTFVKSLEKTIADCKKYSWSTSNQFDEVKNFIKKTQPELFLNESDNHDSIAMEISIKKQDDQRLAEYMIQSISATIQKTIMMHDSMFNK